MTYAPHGYNLSCPKHTGGGGWAIRPSAGVCVFQPNADGIACGEPYTEADWTPARPPAAIPTSDRRSRKPAASGRRPRPPKPVIVDGAVILDMPGKFDSFFDGTGIIQCRPEDVLKNTGYSGGPAVRKAYDEAKRITRGKGYTLRLSIPVADSAAAMDCLADYADVCIVANQDTAGDSTADDSDRTSACSEIRGAQQMLERIKAAREELSTCAHGSYSTAGDGRKTCLYCGATGAVTETPNAAGGTDYRIDFSK